MTIGHEHYKAASERLGLRIDPPEQSLLDDVVTLEGEIGPVPIVVRQFRGDFVQVEFSAGLAPPADFRFAVRPAGLVAKLKHLFGRDDCAVGDPAFDDAFEVSSDEPERVRAFLSPPLRAALLAWQKADITFQLLHDGFYFETIPGAYSTLSADEIVADIGAMANLARVAGDALRQVPPSPLFASQIVTWQAFAAARGLFFSASPLAVWGELDHAPFAARVVPMGDEGHGIDFALRFEARLPWFLRVRHARLFDFLERTEDGSRHVSLDDAAFDRELRVTTSDESRTKAFLDADVRAALLELQRADGTVQLDSDRLAVRTRGLTDPEGFQAIIARVSAVLAKLHDRAAIHR